MVKARSPNPFPGEWLYNLHEEEAVFLLLRSKAVASGVNREQALCFQLTAHASRIALLASAADRSARTDLAVIAAVATAAFRRIARLVGHILLVATGQTRGLLAVAITTLLVVIALALCALALVSAMT